MVLRKMRRISHQENILEDEEYVRILIDFGKN